MISWLTMDVFDGLATLPDHSVDLVVTSPPFLALRSYLPADHPDKSKEIGSEATPAEYLDVLLAVTGELRRVLAPHGSVCVELGDTYAGSGGGGGDLNPDSGGFNNSYKTANPEAHAVKRMQSDGWPLAKSRTLIPQLFELALAYGINPLTGSPSPAGQWRIRNIVTWCRPNPPVGALGDKWRPATSDVVVACLSGRRYWDDLATRKSHQSDPSRYTGNGYSKGFPEGIEGNEALPGNPSGAPLLDYWEIPLLEGEEPQRYGSRQPSPRMYKVVGEKAASSHVSPRERGETRPSQHEAGAPLLDYWEIPPTGYSGAHYAVYPPALIEPLVKAMCPSRVCRTCGEPSRRIVSEAKYVGAKSGLSYDPHVWPSGQGDGKAAHSYKKPDEGARRMVSTLGFTDCGHDDWRPGVILDPFAGSGTTLAVASGHGHDAIGIDLDERNEILARDRIGPLLWEIPR